MEADCARWNDSLQEEAALMHHVLSQLRRYQEDRRAHNGQKWKLPPCGQPISLFSAEDAPRTIIMPQDDSKLREILTVRPMMSLDNIIPSKLDLKFSFFVVINLLFSFYLKNDFK